MPGIGNIADISHFITKMQKIAVDNIKSNIRSCMSQVAFTTDSRTADIHTHMTGMKRNKNFFLPGKRIINFEFGHSSSKCRIESAMVNLNAIGNKQLAMVDFLPGSLLPIAGCLLPITSSTQDLSAKDSDP